MSNESVDERLSKLESIVEKQQEQIEKQQKKIEEQGAYITEKSNGHVEPVAVADGGDTKVVGEIDVADGIGVHGNMIGVDSGRGIYGENTDGDYSFPFSDPFGTVGVCNYGDSPEGSGVLGYHDTASGFGTGVTGTTESPDGAGVWGFNREGGPAIVSNGTLYAKEDYAGNVGMVFEDGTEQTTAGPVAKGAIGNDGSVFNGTNISSTNLTSTDEYEITIADESFTTEEYATSVVPMQGYSGSRRVVPHVREVDNNLVVEFFDTDGSKTRADFHFVTYQLTGSSPSLTSQAETKDSEETNADRGPRT